jgi:hypothetical protein
MNYNTKQTLKASINGGYGMTTQQELDSACNMEYSENQDTQSDN